MPRHTAQDEQVGENIDDIGRIQLPGYPDHQHFTGELIDDVQHPDLTPVMRAILDKVVGPDMIFLLGA